ncbi:MAG: thioredoxin-like domain-containing protein [Rubripirellula sp.]
MPLSFLELTMKPCTLFVNSRNNYRWVPILVLAVGLSCPSYADEPDSRSYPVLSGIGIALTRSEGHLRVGHVLDGSPADKSGILTKDDRLISVEINGTFTSLDGKTVGEAASLIRGPSGTKITLTVEHAGADAEVDVVLTRMALPLEGLSDVSYRSFVGKPAPELVMSTLDGKSTTKLSQHVGKIVVLDFWAPWCATCYAPVAKMQEIMKRNQDWDGKVEMITVSIDEDLDRAVEVVAKQHWNQTTNMATSLDKLKDVGVSVVPVTIIVAADGTIATMAASHALDAEKEVKALLARQLNK